jgi:hypothetical protein
MRIQILLEPKEYSNAVDIAKVRQLTFSNDSELFRKILYDYAHNLEQILLKIHGMQLQIEQNKQLVIQKEAIIEQLHSQISEKNKEIDILKNNLEICKYDYLHKKHDKK